MDITFDSINELITNSLQSIKHWRFGSKAQLAFMEDLFVLINDGIPPNRAIDMMVQITRGLERDVALSISRKISEGRPLADGMREWFAMNTVEIIRVGEEGGALAETMRSAITTLKQRSGIFGSLIAALTYPLLVIIMACAVIVYLNNSVFIQFKAIKPIEQWPQAGRDLINVAHLIESWWWLVLIVIITVIIIMRRIMTSYVGEMRPVLDNIPPFSLYRNFAAARLMETMGLLVANGVVFKHAIKIMQHQANPYVVSHLMMMEYLLGIGKGNVADVLSTGLIEEKDVLRLRVMAEVKGFEHGLVRMGVAGSEQSAKTIQLIARVVGGILLSLGAALIIIIVRGIYLTGMSMGSV